MLSVHYELLSVRRFGSYTVQTDECFWTIRRMAAPSFLWSGSPGIEA